MMREQNNLSQLYPSVAVTPRIGSPDTVMSNRHLPSPAEEIVEHLYQGILEPKHWRTFLQCLRQYLDCDIAAMLLRSSNCQPVYAIWDRRTSLDESEQQAVADEYRNLMYLDPLFNALKSTSNIYTLDEVVSPAELVKSDYYKRVIKRFDFIHQLAIHVEEPKGLECYIGVINGSNATNFGSLEKQFLAALRSDIECALTIFSRFKHHEFMAGVYSTVLTHLPVGSVINRPIDL